MGQWQQQPDGSWILTDAIGGQKIWAKKDSQGNWTWGYFGSGGPGSFGGLSFNADEFPPPMEWPWPPA